MEASEIAKQESPEFPQKLPQKHRHSRQGTRKSTPGPGTNLGHSPQEEVCKHLPASEFRALSIRTRRMSLRCILHLQGFTSLRCFTTSQVFSTLKGSAAALFISCETCSDSIAKQLNSFMLLFMATLSGNMLQNGVLHRCACGKLVTKRGGYRSILGSANFPEYVSRKMGYRSHSMAISHNMRPPKSLFSFSIPDLSGTHPDFGPYVPILLS